MLNNASPTNMKSFFDVLPTDIYDSIAYHLFSSIECEKQDYLQGRFGLTDNKYLKTFLEYAKKSRAHFSAVMWVMSHRLCIAAGWREETFVDWISTIASELRRLDMLEAPRISFPGKPPKLPKLQNVAITSATEHLSLIRGSPNLSDLRVNIASIDGWDDIVSTIASLPLKTLHLYFSAFMENGNVLGLLEKLSNADLKRLLSACPSVEKFYVNPVGRSITRAGWEMIQGLQGLKTLTLRGRDIRTEGDHIPFIQNISELEIYETKRIEDARRFGSAVTLLEVSIPSSYEQILGLTSFPNLQKLRLVLDDEGAECALAGNIDNVEMLYLSWSFIYVRHPLENFEGAPQSELYPDYHEPDMAVLVHILETARNLKKFKIAEAILSSDAIECLLAIIGPKLENLELCHDWQMEAVPERMERIFQAVIKYCPKLTSLMFAENPLTARYFIISTENQKKRCLIALQQLVSARPGFQSYRILRHTIEHRFVEECPFNMLLWADILPN